MLLELGLRRLRRAEWLTIRTDAAGGVELADIGRLAGIGVAGIARLHTDKRALPCVTPTG